jgi:MSHA biogenesis protein MshP
MKNSRSFLLNGERGFGSVLAVIVLVLMATLAVAILRLSSAQQLTSAQDVLSSRAWAAARAGNEWGLYKALSSTSIAANDPWVTCSNATPATTLDLSATTGFWVKVTCNSSIYNEGEKAVGTAATVRVYVIQATACNSNSGCPVAAGSTSPDYIERVRQVTAATPSVATGF